MNSYILPCIILLGFLTLVYPKSPYEWMPYDAFDQIDDRMNSINAQNCKSKPREMLYLPEGSVSQAPVFNKLLTQIIFPNRTALLHVHNMALNRAFYFSYIFQKLDYSDDFMKQPGLMYHYFSVAADVSANEYNINGSGIFYDVNGSYANWYENLRFNFTLDLFGPRAWRFDDFNDPTNYLREPTNRTIDIVDYAAGSQNNYTLDSFKTNSWYKKYLPDGWDQAGKDSDRKFSYTVGIKYSDKTGQFRTNEFEGFVFFGPTSPGLNEKEDFPVEFTEPYFDCGKSNRWIVSAVAPVVDWLPRYLKWLHIRRHKFVATTVVDMEFLAIDINPCPLGTGNELPNYFAGTAKCKPNTMCEPIAGWGFRRGGYVCHCMPGYRFPQFYQGPWKGEDIEMATEEEYANGFECIEVELTIIIPAIRGNDSLNTGSSVNTLGGKKKRSVISESAVLETSSVVRAEKPREAVLSAKTAAVEKTTSKILDKKRRFLKTVGLREEKTDEKIVPLLEFHRNQYESKRTRFRARNKRSSKTEHHRSKRAFFNQDAWDRMTRILVQKESVNAANCYEKNPADLILPGDVGYNVDVQFSPQARTALRLAHFLSNFLQNIDTLEEYGNLRGDNLLNIEQIFGEVLANVMGDLRVKGSGVFFDIDKFKGPDGEMRQLFGPYAYRNEGEGRDDTAGEDKVNTHFRAIDYAGFPDNYLDKHFFRNIKERWQANNLGLEKFTQKPMIRSDKGGETSRKFELYPMYYHAPREKDGLWSAPYFDCNGYVNEWVLTYSVPFFGKNMIGSALEFKGVVTVDVKLDDLDMHQCPMNFDIANAFKNTARCHFQSTYCEQLPGRKFRRGLGYKCECLQAYEYPFEDRAWFFDGQSMEEEYRKKQAGDKNSRYDNLKCRIAGSSQIYASWTTLLLALMLTLVKS